MKPSIFSSIIVLPLFITLVSAQDEQVNAGAEEITISPTLVIRGQESKSTPGDDVRIADLKLRF